MNIKNEYLARAVLAWASFTIGIFFLILMFVNPFQTPKLAFSFSMIGCFAVAFANAFVQSFLCLKIRRKS